MAFSRLIAFNRYWVRDFKPLPAFRLPPASILDPRFQRWPMAGSEADGSADMNRSSRRSYSRSFMCTLCPKRSWRRCRTVGRAHRHCGNRRRLQLDYVASVFDICREFGCRAFASIVETDARPTSAGGLRKNYAYLSRGSSTSWRTRLETSRAWSFRRTGESQSDLLIEQMLISEQKKKAMKRRSAPRPPTRIARPLPGWQTYNPRPERPGQA